MHLFNLNRNLKITLTLFFLSFSLASCYAGNEKRPQKEICGISFPLSVFSVEKPYGGQPEFSAAENASYTVLGRYISAELATLGAKVTELPVKPSRGIMKRPPTFGPRDRINIFAEFSCAGTDNKEKKQYGDLIILTAPYADKDRRTHTAMLMNIAAGFIQECSNRENSGRKTGLAAVFYDSGSEEAAITATEKIYGNRVKCFTAVSAQ